MPMPLSATVISTMFPRTATSSDISPPSGVYLQAFASRLPRTWTRRNASASTLIGSGGMVIVSR